MRESLRERIEKEKKRKRERERREREKTHTHTDKKGSQDLKIPLKVRLLSNAILKRLFFIYTL